MSKILMKTADGHVGWQRWGRCFDDEEDGGDNDVAMTDGDDGEPCDWPLSCFDRRAAHSDVSTSISVSSRILRI